MIDIGVLENNSHRAGGNTCAAIRTFFFIHDIGPDLILSDRVFGAGLGTFSALCADIGPVFSRIGEFRINPKGSLFRINIVEMFDRTDLATETAARAIVFVDFYSHKTSW
jgi:hypothetical protein